MNHKRPNILLITSDQQHWNTLGFANPEVQTPNLDRLAASGTVFTRAYCTNPTCTPCRASIITGRYPSQHGAWSLGTKLPESEHTVGEDFSAAGYRTALVGKAHFQPLDSTPEFSSLEAYPVLHDLEFWRKFDQPFYGFQHVELARNHGDEGHAGQHYALWMEANGLPNWRDYFSRPPVRRSTRQHKWNLPERFHMNAWIAERTNALMEQYQKEGAPFFLWASFFDPHPPYLVPEPWDTLYDPARVTVPSGRAGEHDANPPHFRKTQEANPDFSMYQEKGGAGCHGFHSHLQDRDSLAKDIAVYYGMISCMDKYIGKILDRLDALGLRENTLVVFTTDHGHFFGHHGLIAKGAFHYEDMIRVPFLASWPGRIPAGRSTDALQSLADLAPTFLGFSGLPIPRIMTGVNQQPVWSGEQGSVRDHAIVENRHQPTTINHKTYVDRRYKITVYYGQPCGELFDLQEDPGELRNRWDDPACQALKSELLLKFMQAEMGKEPLWMPRISGA